MLAGGRRAKMVGIHRTGMAWLTILLALALCSGRAYAQAAANQTTGNKPNIVFILVDNLGYGELGIYGGGILRGAPTPRIDKLASEGTRLLNFNVEAQCTPSRSALMTGRFSIRSGTYAVPIGGVADGLTLWEITIAELLSGQGYATGIWGKWHLGSAEARFPTHQGFDEWYGIPRTYDEAFWPSLNETKGLWPSTGNKQGWDPNIALREPIYEAHKGERARKVGELNLETRRTMEAEITNRAVEFIKRNASSSKPFYAYVSSSMVHMPTLPNPEFAGKTGNGDWADCLAELDYRTGQILDAIKEAGVEDNTVVIFASDNGPEATDPWEGDSGPWRGTYFTAMEASLRAPFIIRWPGKVPAGRVSNEIVHIVDMYPNTRAHWRGKNSRRSAGGWSGPIGFFPWQRGFQPGRFPRLCGRQVVRGQMAELEDAPDLAGEYVRSACDSAAPEGDQSPYRSKGGARRGRDELLGCSLDDKNYSRV
jgi:arylsulfatase A-like enzyme